MDRKGFVELGQRGLLTVSGEDRRAFLQGLISNDVNKVDPARAIYSGFLTAQGRFLHDFFVAEIGDVLYLDCERERLDDLRRRLSLYKLRSKVALAAADTMAVVALFGPGTLAALGLPEQAGGAKPHAGGIVYVDPRLVGLGARAIVPKDKVAAFEQAGFQPVGFEHYDALRLSTGRRAAMSARS
jgi:folate-binding Fe-S cluster repair protein YgfZ